jgi:sensor histidine kinase regulating citrate/malate metabolism
MDVKGKKTTEEPKHARGKLKIGDDWNAITIIALSQSNPLKAIAELVENCIDAQARTVTITRGREHGQHFLTIREDGEGVPRDAEMSVEPSDTFDLGRRTQGTAQGVLADYFVHAQHPGLTPSQRIAVTCE